MLSLCIILKLYLSFSRIQKRLIYQNIVKLAKLRLEIMHRCGPENPWGTQIASVLLGARGKPLTGFPREELVEKKRLCVLPNASKFFLMLSECS